MKTTSTKLTIAAAILAVTAGVASAQAMKAEVPFAFRAGNTVLPAGDYRIDVKGNHRIVTLSNFDAKQTIMLLPAGSSTAPKAWRTKGDPVLAFECGAGRCSLVQLWTGDSDALSLPHPKLGGTEQAMIMLIPLTRSSAD
jgi:hypothetical protein